MKGNRPFMIRYVNRKIESEKLQLITGIFTTRKRSFYLMFFVTICTCVFVLTPSKTNQRFYVYAVQVF